MRMSVVVLCVSVLAALSGCGKAAKVHTGVPRDYSALGDLSEYKKIAEETLELVDKGDLGAAKTRIKDLETAWTAAEATVKPKNEQAWTSVNKAIDHALTQLRNASPDKDKCGSSLKALIAKLSPTTPPPTGETPAAAAPTTAAPTSAAPTAPAPAATAPTAPAPTTPAAK